MAKKNTPANTPGKPNKPDRPIGPAELDSIRDRWLRGQSHREIGVALGVAHTTIGHHLKQNIIPIIQQTRSIDTRKQLARVEYLYRVAWDLFSKSQKPEERIIEEELIAAASGHGEETAQLAKRITSKLYRVGDNTWLDLVKWCLDFFAKCGGMYTTQYAGDQKDEELRVAGIAPDQLDHMNMERIAKRVQERREYQEALRAQGIGHDPENNKERRR